MNTSFWSLPQTSGNRDYPVGVDELGNTVYSTAAGDTYTVRTQPANRESVLGGLWNALSANPVGFGRNMLAGAAEGVWQGVSAPGRAAAGEPVTYGDAAATAMDWALPQAPGMFRAQDPNVLNIFAGQNAKTADHAALSRAQDMAAQGAGRDDIWSETGWFAGPDGKWRFEIDDSGAGYNVGFGGRVKDGRVPSAFNHPELMDAYDFSDVYTYPSDSGFRAGTGSYSPPTYWGMDGPHFKTGDVRDMGRLEARGSDIDQLNSVGLHELQHGVQFNEGFARGSNPSDEAADIAARRDAAMMAEIEQSLSPQEQADLARFRELKSEYDGAATIPGDVVIEVHDLKKKLRRLDDLMEDVRRLRRAGRGGALEGGAIERGEAFEQYRRVAGEAESRNVEARRHMTAAERRATPPWATLDVPEDELIVRY